MKRTIRRIFDLADYLDTLHISITFCYKNLKTQSDSTIQQFLSSVRNKKGKDKADFRTSWLSQYKSFIKMLLKNDLERAMDISASLSLSLHVHAPSLL